jgi:hypothetical protein
MCWRSVDSHVLLQHANALNGYYTDHTYEETIAMHSASIRLSKGTGGVGRGAAVRTRVSKMSAVEDMHETFFIPSIQSSFFLSRWLILLFL